MNQIRRLHNEYRFDLWQVTIGHPLGVAVVDYFKKNRIPCILRCSGEDIQIKEDIGYGIRLNKHADDLIRKNYKNFDACVAISDAMVKEYRALDVEQQKIRKISNGVDWARFHEAREDRSREQRREKIRNQFGVKKDDKLIVTVGRNHPKKGFALIPEIVSHLLKKDEDFVWLIVGEGSQAIKELAEKSGPEVSRRIQVTDTIGLKDEGYEYPSQELIEVLDAADIFAFPTFLETFGIVVIEAMAAGLPVVTTDAPGVNELVEADITGLKSPAGNTLAMAENIGVLLNQEDYFRRIKYNVIKESEKYDWDHISDLYLNLYQEMVE